MVKLTMKTSLIRAAKSLPSSIEDVKAGALLPGYVASVTPDAVFVRFQGSLTGRAGARFSPTVLVCIHWKAAICLSARHPCAAVL